MPKTYLQQNAVVLTIVFSFFALSFTVAAAVGRAQTSKKSAKAAPTPTPTPAKKTAKTTPTPSKKPEAKPETKKSTTTSAKEKAADKKPTAGSKTSAKTSPKDSRKDSNVKTAAKTKETPSKKTASKAADKKTANSKSTTAKTGAKNSKTETAAKKSVADKRPAAKTPVKQNNTAKTVNRAPAVKNTEQEVSEEAPQIIVTDVSARIRSQAKASAPELTRPKLGTILRVAEKTPAWYRVQYSAGAKTSSGWISANSVNDLNAAGRNQLYRQIADRYYKSDGMDFATASELYEFLNRAGDELNGSDTAELELKKLLALRSALRTIPAGRTGENPYRDFLKSNEKSVVYSEPAGEWYVGSNLFWDLHTKFEKSPLADQIAWEAAQNPLPGECEGYVNCYLFYGRMTSGEYLRLHPTGKKSLEALINLTNLLEPIVAGLEAKSVYTGPTDVTDRAEFNNLIAELRTIVSRLPLTEKEKPLQHLRKIAEGFR